MTIAKQLTRTLLSLIIFAGSISTAAALPDDRRIEEIRRIHARVNELIIESERSGEGSELYLNELVVNKGDKSWPAVGIYKTVYRFYYTFGDREKDPYPNRLLKITVATERSARHEYAEYLFNPAGQLIFYLERQDESPAEERRLYFAAGKLIRIMSGQRTVATNTRDARNTARLVLSETRKLSQVFLKTLGN